MEEGKYIGSRKTDSQKIMEKYLKSINRGNSYLFNNDREDLEIEQLNTPFSSINDNAISFKDLVPSQEQKRAFEATSIFEPGYIPEDILDFYYPRSPKTLTLSPTSTDSDISNLSLYLVWARTGTNYDPAHLTDEGIYLEDNYLNESSSDEELIEGIRKLNITPAEDISHADLKNGSNPKRQIDDEEVVLLNPFKKTKTD